MEKTLYIKNFIDTSEWLSKLKLLDTAAQNNKVTFHCKFNNKIILNYFFTNNYTRKWLQKPTLLIPVT